MRRATAAALALLAMAVPGFTPDASAANSPAEWFGPVTDAGWHIRVPLRVEHPAAAGFTAASPVVAAEIDIEEALGEAGWPRNAAQGDLASFDLDLDSIRVVEMTDDRPPAAGTIHGRIKVQDPGADGLAKYVVASAVLPGRLAGPLADAFHSRLEPSVTVLWRVPGSMAPGSERHFMVYFDSLLNTDHSATEAQPASRAVDSVFWAGPSLQLYGAVPAFQSQETRPVLRIVGLHDDTKVAVSTLTNGVYRPLPSPTGGGTEFTLGRDQERDVLLSNGPAVRFRVDADRPVLAYVEDGVGFVPATTGGFAGHEFVFRPRTDTVHAFHSGEPTPTVLSVVPLSGGPETRLYLSHPNNPLPYTLGPWAYGGSDGSGQCVAAGGPYRAMALTPGRTYKATVIEGGPVLLQLEWSQARAAAALHQVPTTQGGPTGTSFRGVVQDFGDRTQPCRFAEGEWRASSSAGVGALVATNAERPFQVDPAGTAAEPSPPGHPVAAAPLVSGPFQDGGQVRERPLDFRLSGASSWLFAGDRQASGVAVAGPLGGPLGMAFQGLGPTDVFALFNDTQVKAVQRHSVNNVSVQTFGLGEGQSLRLDHKPGNDQLLSFHLTADKPLAVYPALSRPGFLAGLPYLANATVGAADFRGRLIGLESEDFPGLDPVSKDTLPGEPVQYALRVRNLGRGANGQPLADTVDLSLSGVPKGWEASLDRAVVPLPDASAAPVILTVTPGAGLAARERAAITVRATSQGDRDIMASLDTLTFLKPTYAVGLWFDVRNGTTSQPGTVSNGTNATYKLVVHNLGSLPDLVGITTTPTPRGWSVLVLANGTELPAGGLALAPGTGQNLTLRVAPPNITGDDVLVTTVTATSLSSPAAFSRVVATTRLRAPSTLSFAAAPSTQAVRPGSEAVFAVTVQNTGLGGAELAFEARGDAASGWTVPQVFLTDPTTGTRTNLTRLSVGPGDTVGLSVGVRPNASAAADSLTSIRVGVRLRDGPEVFDAILTAIVSAEHRIETQVQPESLRVAPGGQRLAANITATNRGNLDEALAVRVSELPAGWRLDVPAVVALARNQSQAFTARLDVAPGEPPGARNVAVLLVSSDGTEHRVPIHVEVLPTALVRIGNTSPLQATPGTVLEAAVAVTNIGNLAAGITVDGGPWNVTQQGSLTLPVNGSGELRLRWNVPRGAPLGSASLEAVLLVRPPGNLSPERLPMELSVELDLPQLAVLAERTAAVPGGMAVQATVANVGRRPASGVVVALQDGEAVLDQAVLAALAAGETVNVSLLAPTGVPEGGRIVVDPEDRIAEADETDNARSVAAHDPEAAPGPAAWIALAFALPLARGRRPGERDGHVLQV